MPLDAAHPASRIRAALADSTASRSSPTPPARTLSASSPRALASSISTLPRARPSAAAKPGPATATSPASSIPPAPPASQRASSIPSARSCAPVSIRRRDRPSRERPNREPAVVRLCGRHEGDSLGPHYRRDRMRRHGRPSWPPPGPPRAGARTVLISPPSVLRHFLDDAGGRAFPTLRLATSRRAAPPAGRGLFFEAFPSGVEIVYALGLTEACMVRQLRLPGHARFETEGRLSDRPIGSMEVVLLDGEGRRAADGAEGQIAVKHRDLAAGYWGKPALTAAALRNRPGRRPAHVPDGRPGLHARGREPSASGGRSTGS